MLQNPPAEPGMAEEEVDTPALLVDLDALEHNLDRMAAFAARAGIRLRPHAKTHKSPVIAHWQARRGAVGQCVQKVGEAEILAWAGVPDILITNEIVAPRKLARVAALSKMTNIALCADDAGVVDLIEAAAEAASCRLTVLVEIHVGANRAGVGSPAAAIALAERIASSHALIFGGLQAYHGGAQHLRDLDARRAAIASVADAARAVVDGLAAKGIACPAVTGAGTGTFELEAASGVFTELQAGSYAFMDADYGRNRPAPDFRQSLFVAATVMSAAREGVAVVDCGHKGIAIESGLPLVHERPGVTYAGASDEHGQLACAAGTKLSVGERLRLVPGHCDPTVDRYDWYVGVRDGWVEAVWPVAARGMMA
ncbi:DSD1 family PLP-dependent enzyme [Aurantimonas coralicida]|uniref:DSD1 family PLP-dependent enzyme n=1 Tax=Aurantimonas coralicida TaxID=182270 RepID=UPI001D18FBA4|nr:DSD1 family PLP-dependent enzyme [Aurantimonas coralicida]MCC4297417.1 DSD1 family PLP-dependent enzyme [Aurantimonas coralicida]MDE0921677.1 DSD1 family PLP-dependent enzyme [Aurantimonas coralicida]